VRQTFSLKAIRVWLHQPRRLMIWPTMKLLLDYRKNAAECRKIARLLSLMDDREHLLRMAEEWEFLAERREAQLHQQCSTQANGLDRDTKMA
jgi:hypothetical protein